MKGRIEKLIDLGYNPYKGLYITDRIMEELVFTNVKMYDILLEYMEMHLIKQDSEWTDL
jgi:hypothetical protein